MNLKLPSTASNKTASIFSHPGGNEINIYHFFTIYHVFTKNAEVLKQCHMLLSLFLYLVYLFETHT